MTAGRKCARWCDYREAGPHSGRCVHHIGEVMLTGPGEAYAVAVTVESTDRRPHPFITVAGRGSVSYALARMTWSECDALAALLTAARRSYA